MKKAFVLAMAVLATSVVAASAQGSQTKASRSLASFNCKKTITLPFVTPITGGAGFLGAEQMSWAQYAVKTLAPGLGLKVKLVGGDTPVEQGPAPAQTLAQKYIGTPSVLALLGPSTSGAVAASTKAYAAAKLAHISPSATRTTLTKTVGGTFDGSNAFFRDVPGDYIQGPTDANYMIKNLHVKKVVIMDFQEPYSLGLASAVDRTLKAKGVSTIRLSAPNTTTAPADSAGAASSPIDAQGAPPVSVAPTPRSASWARSSWRGARRLTDSPSATAAACRATPTSVPARSSRRSTRCAAIRTSASSTTRCRSPAWTARSRTA